MKLYQRIAQAMDAHQRVNADDNFAGDPSWLTRHRDIADALCKRFLPRGSGIDNGVKIDWDLADHMQATQQFVLIVDYHNMDEHGGYDGWSHYTIRVRASLAFDFDLRIVGGQRKYRQGDKDYLYDLFNAALGEEVSEADYKSIVDGTA
jgi:hypothetical protein